MAVASTHGNGNCLVSTSSTALCHHNGTYYWLGIGGRVTCNLEVKCISVLCLSSACVRLLLTSAYSLVVIGSDEPAEATHTISTLRRREIPFQGRAKFEGCDDESANLLLPSIPYYHHMPIQVFIPKFSILLVLTGKSYPDAESVLNSVWEKASRRFASENVCSPQLSLRALVRIFLN